MIKPIEQDAAVLPAQILAVPKEVQADPKIGKSAPEIGEEWVHNKTRIEEGQVMIEQYDESGKLLKITPPGYLPFGEVV